MRPYLRRQNHGAQKEERGFPDGSEDKEAICNSKDTGNVGLIADLGRCLGEGNGNPLQYSCLENLMDRGAWWATDHGVAKGRTGLSNQARKEKSLLAETSEKAPWQEKHLI